MKTFKELNIIEKIFIKEYAQRTLNMRYHTNNPNMFCQITNELSVCHILSCKLPTFTLNK